MSIESDAMHIWRARTTVPDDDESRLRAILSPDEQARANRFRDPRARAQYTVARAALRTVLARYIGCDAGDLHFAYTSAGKPSIDEAGPGHGMRFSLSHAADFALIAVAREHEVGVDIERVRRVSHAGRIARRLFPETTRATLARLDPDERATAFVHAWTQREALVKAVGGGMYVTSDPLEFSWPRPHPPEVQRTDFAPHGIDAWTIAPLTPASGYAATAVAGGIATLIRLWNEPLAEGT